MDAEEAVRRLDKGDVAIVGIVEGDLAHLQWISFRSPWVNEIGVTLRLAPGESTAYGAFTAPAWRGHGIHALASRFLNEEAATARRHPDVAWVWASNRASRRVLFAKLGRRRTKTVWSFRVLGMRRPLLIGATATGSPSLVRRAPEAPRALSRRGGAQCARGAGEPRPARSRVARRPHGGAGAAARTGARPGSRSGARRRTHALELTGGRGGSADGRPRGGSAVTWPGAGAGAHAGQVRGGEVLELRQSDVGPAART